MNEARIYKLAGPEGQQLYVKAKTQAQARNALSVGWEVNPAGSAEATDHVINGGKVIDMTAKPQEPAPPSS